MVSKEAIIVENLHLTGSIAKIKFELNNDFPDIRPGQFVSLKIRSSDACPIFLRRPFTIYGLFRKNSKTYLEILFEVVGKGTSFLYNKREGEKVDLLGPLGNGCYNIDNGKKYHLIIAGGIGIAGVRLLAESLKGFNDKFLLYGARSKKELVLKEDFENLGFKTFYSTDDGSFGKKGFVTELFSELISDIKSSDVAGYTCGPDIMMRKIFEIAKEKNIDIQFSLEGQMGCGIGACYACVCKVRDSSKNWHYSRICSDGPVFHISRFPEYGWW